MIGLIRGIIIEKQAPLLLIDVQGVGYEINAPMTTFYNLPAIGKEVSLHTHFVVREDAQLLYGFYSKSDRALFRTLIKVNGVGPKLALTILSGMDADAFVHCINEGNATALVKLPGVGKKTAERLVVEMRDRLKDWQGGGSVSAQTETLSMQDVEGETSPVSDAESALVSLGYKPAEATKAVRLVTEVGLNSEELIKRALRNMVKA